MSRIYLASSWRCPTQPEVLARLRAAGHEVYDFRNPAPGNTGFGWRQAGDVSAPGPYLKTLRSPVAAEGFRLDKAAMDWADTCVLLLPCGRSAHLEAGYMAGEGKRVFVLLSEDKFEPELMYLLCTAITDDLSELLRLLADGLLVKSDEWESLSPEAQERLTGAAAQHRAEQSRQRAAAAYHEGRASIGSVPLGTDGVPDTKGGPKT